MQLVNTALERLNLQRFFSGEGPLQQPVQLNRSRVYILPTRAGLFFALLLLLMLIGSINYSNNLGYMLTFLLASLAVVTILYTYRNLLNLNLSVLPARPVFAGEPLKLGIVINNPYHARYSVRVSSSSETISIDIDENIQTRAMLSLITNRRGRHPLPRLTIDTIFPLGLFRAWSYFEVDSHYLVYPAPHGRKQLPNHSDYRSTLQGDLGQGSDDFAGQRKYHPGDSLKQVNWKALAKEQGLLTKQFGGDRHEELWLNWRDTSGLPIEQRLSQLTLWILQAETAGISYGLQIPGLEIPLSSGPAHRDHCLESLAVFTHV